MEALMVPHREFLNLVLDDEGLHTPEGTLVLARITKAELIRETVDDSEAEPSSPDSPSYGGVVGGALVGGAVAGAAGAVGGALVGSALDRDDADGEEDVHRTVAATIQFASPELAYTTTVRVSRVQEAQEFVEAVQQAAGLC
jgi:uncharacterized protein YcfJ